MFCEKCGTKIPDGATSCPNCGEPVASDANAVTEGVPAGNEIEGDPDNGGIGKKFDLKKMDQKQLITIGVAAVVVVILIIVLAATVFSSKKVNLNDYLTVEFTGYDGYGKVSTQFDRDALAEKFDDKIQMTDQAKDWGYRTFSDYVYDHVYYRVSPVSGLSNGDEVELTWEDYFDNSDNMIKTKVKFTYDDNTFEVSGLEPVTSFDAFAGVSLGFSGTSPEAKAYVEYDEGNAPYSKDIWDYLSFSLSKSDGLAKGDTVMVMINENCVDNLLTDMGIYPEEMSKDYVVENLPYYLSSLDELPDDALAKMDSQAQDAFNAYVAQRWNAGTLTSIDYIGSYLLCPKQAGSTRYNNIIYMVYRYKSILHEETDVTGYWYCGFYDGIFMDDGTFSIDYMNYTTPNDQFTATYNDGRSRAYYIGYSDLDSLFNKIVATQIAEYTYESTVEDIVDETEEAAEGTEEDTEAEEAGEDTEAEETEEDTWAEAAEGEEDAAEAAEDEEAEEGFEEETAEELVEEFPGEEAEGEEEAGDDTEEAAEDEEPEEEFEEVIVEDFTVLAEIGQI